MGIKHYLVNKNKKEYMNFGKICPVIPNTFFALRSGEIDIDLIPDFVRESKWSKGASSDFIDMIGNLLTEIATDAGDDLILICDDVYSDMGDSTNEVIDYLIDNIPEFADWYGIIGKTRARESWYCKFDIYEYHAGA